MMDVGTMDSPTKSISDLHQLNSSEDNNQFHNGRDGQLTGSSSKVLLAYRNLNSPGVKAGLDILKVAATRWKQEKKLRTGASENQMSTKTGYPCKKSPLDHLASLVLHGHCQIEAKPRQDPLNAHKPQNCKRIVVLGAPRVGKTSILRRYLRDGFVEDYKPTTEDFLRKLFCIRGETYQLDILDASRERDFPAKRRLSILTGDIFLLVFSLDDRRSFDEVCELRAEIQAAKSKLTKFSTWNHSAQLRVPLVICANKMDLQETERAISDAEVLQALGEDCAYFETSAKDSTNLEKVFETLAKRGGFPCETGPSQHRKVSLRSYQAIRTGCRRQVQGRDDPCGTLYPLARRPSFSTDLRQVIGSQTSKKHAKGLEKCNIQ